jgi:hypothetical protein
MKTKRKVSPEAKARELRAEVRKLKAQILDWQQEVRWVDEVLLELFGDDEGCVPDEVAEAGKSLLRVWCEMVDVTGK